MARLRDLAFLTADPAGTVGIRLPEHTLPPLVRVARRFAVAIGVLALVTLLVYWDRGGYRDVDGEVSFLDALYYSTVTLSTTGYGDVTPVSDAARLFNVLVITPLRIVFLVALVGTTIEVLTQESRRTMRITRWRQELFGHTVIVGYGVKGRAAAEALMASGVRREQIVMLEPSASGAERAMEAGFVVVQGDGAQEAVLEKAGIRRAARVVVAVHDDDSAVLITMTARRMNPTARIVASLRESDNAAVLQQGGADSIITSSESAGRLLGLAADSPGIGDVLEDLLVSGSGLEITERNVTREEIGGSPRAVADPVVSVSRNGMRFSYDDPAVDPLRGGDKLVLVRSVRPTPPASGG